MLSPAWIALLRRIPPLQHDNLVVTTTIGGEISVQNIVRMEDEYLIIRGRTAGTSDNGRVFFIPYDQISRLAFQKEVKEPEIHALYAEPNPDTAAAQPRKQEEVEFSQEKVEAAPTLPPPPQPGRNEKQTQETATTPVRAPIPSRQALLERLRQARNQTAGKSAAPPKP
jgi:hypothetical protein